MCGFDIFCHNFNWWIGSYLPPQATGMRGGGRGLDDFCCVMIKSTWPPKALQYSNDPNHLQSVLYSPPFILSYRRLIPSPFPLPKNSSRPPPFTDKLLTGSEIHKSDVTFSAVVPISFISIRIRFWNLETPTIRQFVLIFSYLDT